MRKILLAVALLTAVMVAVALADKLPAGDGDAWPGSGEVTRELSSIPKYYDVIVWPFTQDVKVFFSVGGAAVTETIQVKADTVRQWSFMRCDAYTLVFTTSTLGHDEWQEK